MRYVVIYRSGGPLNWAWLERDCIYESDAEGYAFDLRELGYGPVFVTDAATFARLGLPTTYDPKESGY